MLTCRQFARYGIPAGDSSTRLQALQRKYDDEFDAGTREYEAYLHRLELEKTKATFLNAVQNVRVLEQQALDREPKIRTIVLQIEENVASKHLIVRGISPLACCALLRAMRDNTNVVSLDLASSALTDSIAVALGKMLAANKTLRVLNLGCNDLTSKCLGPLGEGLQENSVISSLVLESNSVFQLQKDNQLLAAASGNGNAATTIPPMGVIQAFLTAIEVSKSLSSLNLYNTGMSYESGRALCKALSKNISIVSMEIGGNTLTQTDLISISKQLQINQERIAASEDQALAAIISVRERADLNRQEQEKLAKQKADADWHEENARKRHEIRQQEEWERARIKSEEEVAHLLQMEAENKKYIEMREAEKKPKAKGKGKK